LPEIRTLKNGLRLILDPMAGLETAAIGVWVKAGTADESAEENGVAHLLEHMAFKGTRRRTAREIVETIENVGGYLNAATSYQRTGYYARILKNDMPLAVDLLADILTEPLFDSGELEKEKEVVVQEIGEAFDQPDDAVGEMLQAELFKGQPLGRPILGSVETVRSHDPARLRGFMERLYLAGNTIVAAAGAFDPERLVAEVEARFAPLGAGGENRARPPAAYVGGAAHDDRDIEQCHLMAAFPAVGTGHTDYYAANVFAELMGGGMASRLFQKIREERGLAYSVHAYADCYEGDGLIGVYVGTDPDKAGEAARLLKAEMTAAAEGMTSAELDRARNVMKASRLMSLESPSNRIDTAASQLLTWGKVLSAEDVCARLDAVTLDDLQRCARRALDAAAPSLSVVGPGDFDDLVAAIRG
jgi:predicted Zn-dependent peptidase